MFTLFTPSRLLNTVQIFSLDLSHSTFLYVLSCGFIKTYFQPRFVLQHTPYITYSSGNAFSSSLCRWTEMTVAIIMGKSIICVLHIDQPNGHSSWLSAEFTMNAKRRASRSWKRRVGPIHHHRPHHQPHFSFWHECILHGNVWSSKLIQEGRKLNKQWWLLLMYSWY